jgi:hypothetical protein
MDNETIRAALKAELVAQRRQKRRRRLWRTLNLAMLLLCLAAFSFPLVSAKYVDWLASLAPVGLDSVTNTDLTAALYPVGSLYISTENITPGTAFGGTWEVYSSGRCIVTEGTGYAIGALGGTADTTRTGAATGTVTGVGGAISMTGTAAAVGQSRPISTTVTGVGGAFSLAGSFTLTTANLPSHYHTMAHTHNIPEHTHTFIYREGKNGWPNGSGDTNSDGNDLRNHWRGNNSIPNNGRATQNPTPGNSGDSSVANTANAGSGTAKAVTSSGTAANLASAAAFNLTSAAAGYSGTVTTSGTAANLSGTTSGTATGADKTMQPYLVVYVWRRIA